ncbi:MAG: galactokinase, partial [Microbacterium sp.]
MAASWWDTPVSTTSSDSRAAEGRNGTGVRVPAAKSRSSACPATLNSAAAWSIPPVGAGLSSSAALTCSVALAVDALLGLGLDRDTLAVACVRAENDHVGV